MSDQIRAWFEADARFKTGETRKGKDVIYQMQDILKQVAQKSRTVAPIIVPRRGPGEATPAWAEAIVAQRSALNFLKAGGYSR